MALSVPEYFKPPQPDQFQVDQQQASQDLVPNKDTANPETEEQKRIRLANEQASKTPEYKLNSSPSNPDYHTNFLPGDQYDQGNGGFPPAASSPMVTADGGVPAGVPYSPVSTAPTVAQTTGQPAAPFTNTSDPTQAQAELDAYIKQQNAINNPAPTPQPTGRALEDQWMDFANTVLGQKGQVGVPGGNAQPNALAASSRFNLQPIVDQYNQKYGAHAKAVGEDKIDFGDGRGPVDVIAGGGANSQWWYGSPTETNGTGPGSGAGSGLPNGGLLAGNKPGGPGGSGGYSPITPNEPYPEYIYNNPPLQPGPSAPSTPSTAVAPGAAPPPVAPGVAPPPITPAGSAPAAYAPDLTNPNFNQTAPTYTASDITQYTPPDLSAGMGGLDALVAQITGAQSPTYDAANLDQFTAPDQAAGNAQLNKLIQQLMTDKAPTYDAANITQFDQTKNPAISGLQDQRMNDILSNPTYSRDFINKLNEQQKEMILQRGVSDQGSLQQDAARRGVTNSGYTEAAQQRLKNTQTEDLLKSNRDTELNTAGANRQSVLDALASSQGVLSSRAGIESEGYASKLAGETAAANEKGKAYQALLDAIDVKNRAASTASGVLNDQSGRAISQYNTRLTGQQAQASEKGKAFDATLAAQAAKNASASNVAGILNTKSNIANQGYATKLTGEQARAAEAQQAFKSQQDAATFKQNQAALLEQLKQSGASSALSTAQFGEGQRQFNTQAELDRSKFGETQRQFTNQAEMDRAKFSENQRQFDTQSGLARDQFNESTKQFNQSFIEQVRQFDKKLAEQMAEFNKTNELGWANNQLGYDTANLNSQDRMLDRLAG